MNYITTVRPTDAAYLATNLREGDRKELEALSKVGGGGDVFSTIIDSIAVSEHVYAWRRGDRLVALFGVAPHGNFGIPWLLSTPEMYEPACVAYLHDRVYGYMAEWLAQYGTLLNMVHAENEVCIRWLTRCGFKVGPKLDFNAGTEDAVSFHHFRLDR